MADQTQTRTAEIRSLTGLRGVAAIMVVLYHFGLAHVGSTRLRSVLDHGYLWVDLFFCLSGFVLCLGYGTRFVQGIELATYGRFVLDRAARIFPLLWFVTAAALLLAHVETSHAGGTPSAGWLPVAANLALVQAWGVGGSIVQPAWSLSTEWLASLAFPCLSVLLVPSRAEAGLPVTRGLPRSLLAALLAVCVLAWLVLVPTSISKAVRFRGMLDMTDGANYAPALRCMADFTLGMACYVVSRTRAARSFCGYAWLSSLVAFIIAVLLALPCSDLAVVLLFPVLIGSLIDQTSPVSRVLGARPVRALGLISYSIYLDHTVIIDALMDPVLAWLKSRHIPASGAVGHVFVLACCLAVASLTYRLVERPGQQIRAALHRCTRGRRQARQAGS